MSLYMGDITDHPDFETFDLDDTDNDLDAVGEAIEQAVKNQHDVPDDANIITYTIDADASHEANNPGPAGKFEVGALVLND